MTSELLAKLQNAVQKNPDRRFLLAICGAPGAGKSTLAEWIVNEWNRLYPDQAVLIPMDGYHYPNERLEAMGMLPLKGIPESFDASSFLAKISKICSQPDIEHGCPKFDRSIEASIDNAIKILPAHKLLVTEGNYLLLNSVPWSQLKKFFDASWFIDAKEEIILPRLLERHKQGGKDDEAALRKVKSTDLPNARLVASSATRADLIIPADSLPKA